MPVMDGFEFVRALRQEPGGDKPAHRLLPHRERRGRHRPRQARGADDHMMKPFDKETMEMKFQEVGLL